ncbi:MAG TPA: T9SS type A sorting domain-containing protein [Cyclobacteriaceae bacterium]|nr:T9SS type A sorting domain-containing protein [Cyclobacteriaceae bacterium]
MGSTAATFLSISPSHAQTITPKLNAYRTAIAANSIGDWDDPAIWEVWNGSTWLAADSPPARTSDVFIERQNEVRLTKNEEVADLYLFASEGAGKKLNLQVFNLDIYGSLRCFTKQTGEYLIYGSTSLTEDWIYPEQGNLVFKGSSRTIVDRSSWSGNNGQSKFGVVFNPEPDATLTINSVFKASSFTILSGTIYQTVNVSGTAATSSFSFNFQDDISLYDYGSLVIEPGATLISEASRRTGQVIMRTENRPASTFHLKKGATLVLLGQEPIIDAVNIHLEGDVYYSGNTDSQSFIQTSMSGLSPPYVYNNLFFHGEAVKLLPNLIELTGNWSLEGTGPINSAGTSIHFTGEADQVVNNKALELLEVVVDKPAGTLLLQDNLMVLQQFTMASGQVDLQDHELLIYGNYSYTAGDWHNLSRLSYYNMPATLAASNGTFPFVDKFLGGTRSIVLRGNLNNSSTDLSISYHQFPGRNWDPGFEDDGMQILYALNSYFNFSLSNPTEATLLELRISADNLIVVDDEHLRIIGPNAAAPEAHLPAVDRWAGREITLANLDGQHLTLGSTGVASILPVSWLSQEAVEHPDGILIQWSTTKEENNSGFTLLRSWDGVGFEEIGFVPGTGWSSDIQHYEFLDTETRGVSKVYYQIQQTDYTGHHNYSPVFSFSFTKAEQTWKIFPNPYDKHFSPVTLTFPDAWKSQPLHLQVKSISGALLWDGFGPTKHIVARVTADLANVRPGTYILIFSSREQVQVIRWIKK